MQENTGFSPNELVFGHTVRGPLSLLHDSVAQSEPPQNLLEYVNGFRHRWYMAGEKARKVLFHSQGKMKQLYDRKTEVRHFSPDDQDLALLPLVSSPFQAKFQGPFKFFKRVSEQNYVLETPERRRKTQLCHVNLLKPYFVHEAQVGTGGVLVHLWHQCYWSMLLTGLGPQGRMMA